MNKILTSIAFVTSMFISSTVYAGEVDLSSLSAGNGNSHEHRYVEKFDEESHWRECIICKGTLDRNKHSLSETYTLSSTSCNPNNKKITRCNSCEYYKEEATNIRHVPWGITHTLGGFYTHCNICKNNYLYSSNGSVYKYTDGTIVDHNNFKIPSTLVNELGETFTVKQKRILDIDMQEVAENIEVDYTISNGNIYVNAEFKLTQDVLSHIDLNRINDNSYAYVYCFSKNVYKGQENTGVFVDTSSRSWDGTTNTLKVSFVFPIRDSNKDWTAIGTIQPTIRFIIPQPNDCVSDLYVAKDVEEIYTNFIDPTITSVD